MQLTMTVKKNAIRIELKKKYNKKKVNKGKISRKKIVVDRKK